MKIEARIFEMLTVFFFVIALIYGLVTFFFQRPGGLEWAGTTALVLTGGLMLIAGTYFRFVARRIDTRPEDYENAEVSDGAGELGFFSPHSIWPILVAFAAALVGLGAAFHHFWFVIPAALFLIGTVAGLVFEYHRGPEKH